MRMVRIILAAPSTGAGVLDKSMLYLPLRVWALLSPALSPILEAGDGARSFGGRGPFQVLYCCSDSVLFHTILIPHFPLILLIFPPLQCSRGQPPSISCRFQPLSIAHVLKIKAQAGWMTCRFMAGRVTRALPFSWSPGPRATLVMMRWLSWRTSFEPTSLDSLGKCRIESMSSSWNVRIVLWSGKTLNDFSFSCVRLLLPLMMVPFPPLYPTSCTHLSRVAFNPDSIPPSSIWDCSCFLLSSVYMTTLVVISYLHLCNLLL